MIKKVTSSLFLIFSLVVTSGTAFDLKNMGRKTFLKSFSTVVAALASTSTPVSAFQPRSASVVSTPTTITGVSESEKKVAYKPLSVSISEAGVEVPVACWFPIQASSSEEGLPSTTIMNAATPTYQHRISVRKIGQMLAKWNIPKFVSRDYALRPTSDFVVDGTSIPLPDGEAPVVLLAHGYLGSRYDLAHLAEKLAERGFICIAAEYPESLAASYDPMNGVDRKRINQALLEALQKDWNIQASSYGIVGHSLGCGTALEIGDESWTRVLISGFPRQRDGRPLVGNMLLLTSMNDGLMTRFLTDKNAIPADFSILEEALLISGENKGDTLPRRSILVFDRPDAPNHISFLSEGSNDAMIEFLSPLLPVARLFNIPVLDFDRYQKSRDSKSTAEVVHPIVLRYLEQEMRSSSSSRNI